MQLPKGIKYTYSKKLFYDKYLYKIQLKTKAARYFNACGLSKLKVLIKSRYITDVKRYAEWGKRQDDDTSDTINYTNKIIDALLKHNDFKLCSGQDAILVYTDEESLIQALIALNSKHVKIVSYPDPKVAHLLEKNVIFSYAPYKYKVTCRNLEKGGKDFVTWCKQMGGYDINYAGEYYLTKHDRWYGDFYVHVEDDNFLSMLKLYVDDKIIRRIDRIEYPHIRKTDEINTPSVQS